MYSPLSSLLILVLLDRVCTNVLRWLPCVSPITDLIDQVERNGILLLVHTVLVGEDGVDFVLRLIVFFNFLVLLSFFFLHSRFGRCALLTFGSLTFMVGWVGDCLAFRG
jgi:hypothetical protein